MTYTLKCASRIYLEIAQALMHGMVKCLVWFCTAPDHLKWLKLLSISASSSSILEDRQHIMAFFEWVRESSVMTPLGTILVFEMNATTNPLLQTQ